jgi:hypothetical protein
VGGREEMRWTAEMLVAGEMIQFEIPGLCGRVNESYSSPRLSSTCSRFFRSSVLFL